MESKIARISHTQVFFYFAIKKFIDGFERQSNTVNNSRLIQFQIEELNYLRN